MKKKITKRKITVVLAVLLLLLTGFVIVSLPSEGQFQSGIIDMYIPGGTRFEPDSYQRITFSHYILGKRGNATGLGSLFTISTYSLNSAIGDTSKGLNGGAVKIIIPKGWSLPQMIEPKGDGFVTVTPGYGSGILLGPITIDERTITIPVISGSDEGEKIIVIYGETAFGSKGAKVQSTSDRNVEFEIWENPDFMDPDGWIKNKNCPTVMVVYPWEGIAGDINIIAEQAIGVKSISFVGWDEEDDSAVGVISEDRLSYTIGLQLNNGDEYDNAIQYIEIEISSNAKTDMMVKLHTELSVTNPDKSDEVTDDIHIWYKGIGENVAGQIDPWNYLIKIPASDVAGAGTAKFMMCVNVGNTVEPGFYTFETYIEPTSWEEVKTVNMG